MAAGAGAGALQQLGESFALGEAGSGPCIKQAVVLAGANGSRKFGQQTGLGSGRAIGVRRGREVRCEHVEALNGRVQVTQNAIGNQRGLTLRRMNLGMLDDRELVRESVMLHRHGNSTLPLDGWQGDTILFPLMEQGFPPELWKLVE